MMNDRIFSVRIRVLMWLMVSGALPAALIAQPVTLLGALSPDGEAYIYHNEQPDLGVGFHVVRVADGEEMQLTESPFFPAGNGQEFAFLTSDIYDELEVSLNLNNSQAVFLRVRGDTELAFLMSLAYPQIAHALGRLFIDPEPVTGRNVTYRFVWVDINGDPLGRVTEGNLILEPHSIPVPTNLQATLNGSVLRLEWNYPRMTRTMDDRVIRFGVQMKPGTMESFQPAGSPSILRQSGTDRFETIIQVDPSLTSASFVIEAIDVTGLGRSVSEETTIELRDASAPSAIIEVYSFLTAEQYVALSWAVSPEPFVEGYHIDRFDTDTGIQDRLTDRLIGLLDNTYTDTTAQEGKSYQYTIAAVSNTGVESPRGNAAIIRLPFVSAPPSPFGLEATWQDDGRVELAWQTPPQPERFRTYVVLRRALVPGADRAYAQLNKDQLTARRLSDPGITGSGFLEGMFYEYAVVAADENGLQSDTVFTVLQIPDLTSPKAPEDISAEVVQGSRVQLSWSASTSGDVVTYSVYRAGGDAPSSKITELPRNRLFWIDTDVKTGSTYEYRISAVDSSSNEGISEEAISAYIRSISPPGPVRNIQAVATQEGVQVRWEAVPDSAVTAYLIKRSELANGRYADAGEVSAGTTNWTDPNGRAGNWYRVFAVDPDGNQSRAGEPAQAVIRN